MGQKVRLREVGPGFWTDDEQSFRNPVREGLPTIRSESPGSLAALAKSELPHMRFARCARAPTG